MKFTAVILETKTGLLASLELKKKLEQLPCERILQAFEFYLILLQAKQVEEKRGKFKNLWK